MGIVNAATLIKAQRNVQTPFDLRIRRANGQIETIEFHTILRLLPGKRIVALANLHGEQILVKTFLGRGAQKYTAKEQAGVQHFMSAAVRTPNLLWQAELADGEGQMLAFEYISSSESLQSSWDSASQDDQRLDILTRAMIIIAKLHNQGVVQDDIHLDNFLVSDKRIYIIDGGSVVRKSSPPLPEKDSLHNLSWFFAQFFPKYDEFVQMVMPAYEAIRGWKQDSDRLVSLHSDIFTSRESRKKHYLDKVFRDCTRFKCISSFNQFLMIERNEIDPALEALLADPDHYIDQGKILKKGNSATVALVKIAGRAVVVKRYNIKNTWHGIRRAVLKSRAWTSWLNAHQLEFLGIRSLKPIAMLERRIGPLRRRAYFITEYVEAPDALDCLSKLKNPEVQAEALAAILTHLSESRIAHGDLKATNFLMSEDGPVIIDLDAMREYKRNENFERAFNKDLDRFMKNWEDQPELTRQFEALLAKLSS